MTTLGSILGWIVFGLVVGALARLILPGRQSMSLVMTILLGVAGSFVGGLISSLVFGGEIGFHATDFLWSLIGAVVLLAVYTWAKRP